MTSGAPGRSDRPTSAEDAEDLADNALLATLRERAAARNRERVEELEEWCDTLEHRGGLEPDGLARVGAVVHALVGSAGTFGHPEVSALAGRVGERFRSTDAASAHRVAELRAVLTRVTRLLSDDRPGSGGGDSPLR